MLRLKNIRGEIMQLNDNDLAVIENALRQVMNQGTNYRDMINCREVLTKLQGISPDSRNELTEVQTDLADGIRYDYDDNASL